MLWAHLVLGKVRVNRDFRGQDKGAAKTKYLYKTLLLEGWQRKSQHHICASLYRSSRVLPSAALGHQRSHLCSAAASSGPLPAPAGAPTTAPELTVWARNQPPAEELELLFSSLSASQPTTQHTEQPVPMSTSHQPRTTNDLLQHLPALNPTGSIRLLLQFSHVFMAS